jgi:hypothetical protein
MIYGASLHLTKTPPFFKNPVFLHFKNFKYYFKVDTSDSLKLLVRKNVAVSEEEARAALALERKKETGYEQLTRAKLQQKEVIIDGLTKRLNQTAKIAPNTTSLIASIDAVDSRVEALADELVPRIDSIEGKVDWMDNYLHNVKEAAQRRVDEREQEEQKPEEKPEPKIAPKSVPKPQVVSSQSQ